MKPFYTSWKRKSKLELAAIESLKAAKQIILKNIPKKEIIAIYAKGSFVRREMNEKSDVDTLTILKHSKMLGKLPKLDKIYRHKFKPKIQITGYSLWELKNNRKSKAGKINRPGPGRAVQHLEHYKLVYGKSFKKNDFHQGDDIKRLRTMIHVFRYLFLPGFEKGEFSFSDITKQVFWLVENEQKVRKKNPPPHWGKLVKSIKNKHHIVHDAYRFRKTNIKDKEKQKKFIQKLKRYLRSLSQIIINDKH